MVSIRSRLLALPLPRLCCWRSRRARVRWRSRSRPTGAEETADVIFAKSFVGKTYDDELDIEGWNDLGGGLVRRRSMSTNISASDGTYLVLTSREVTKARARDTPGSYVVTDALMVPQAAKGAVFSIACVLGDDATLQFIGEAKGSDEQGMVDRRPPRLGDLARDRTDRLDQAQRRQLHQSGPGDSGGIA